MALTKLPRSGIADSAVTSAKVTDGVVPANEFPNCSIATDRIADCAVSNAKLANSSITLRGTSVSLGDSITVSPDVSWQSKITSDGSTVTTMVAGKGYFIDNSSAAGLVKLPASASVGDTIAIKDYAGNFATNNLTIQRNSHNIQGAANDSRISTNRASVVLVYVDATKGWLYTNEHNVADLTPFISATGGTVTTSGDYKIHTFTGDGNFVVASAGSPGVRGEVSYLVVAGGGGGMRNGGTGSAGGGGAGGFREGKQTCGSYTASPIAATSGLLITNQTYPITVGGGGAGGNPSPSTGANGSNSVFSTITSAGGGGGSGNAGGSGAGASHAGVGVPNPGGSGNSPPVSPPQGNDGGDGIVISSGNTAGGGGGGAGAAGADGTSPARAGNGGAGVASSITGSPVTRAGGGAGSGQSSNSSSYSPGSGGSGGGGNSPGSAGSANTGGGGGSNSSGNNGGAGGSGIVIIRYKYQ